jgi:hypothetical protein
MVPRSPATRKSAAELFVFDRIRDELPDEWIALHSVGLTIHKRKPWAEIDFVLIGPPGVFCLEVKGGRVTREDGVWYTTPQHGHDRGKRQRLNESPFEQVGSASAELFKFLSESMPRIADRIVGYAVAAPDVEWEIRGPDIDLALVYDHGDTATPFSAFMERVGRRWNEKVGRSWNRKLELLGRVDKQRVLELLRGDFQLVPTLAAVADAAERELVRLTDEQCELFARLADNPRVIARGGAGTGKTVIAVEEARRLAGQGKRVHFTCLSDNLGRAVAESLRDVPPVEVRTLHDQMRLMVEEAGRSADLPDVSDEDLLTLFLPELALEVGLDSDDAHWKYDAVIVDEAQDLLRDAYLDVIEILVGGELAKGCWRFFLDPVQNIFGGVSPTGLERVRAATPVDWPLAINCRNTAPIAAQVALLSGTPLGRSLVEDGPEVEITWYEETADQRKLIADRLAALRHEGFAPGRILLLSKYVLSESVSCDWTPPLTDISNEAHRTTPSALRFSTIGAFKGLEADVVLLVDVDDLSTNDGLASVYVGASRAKLALYVFISNAEHAQFKNLAKEFGRLLAESRT